VQEHDQRSRQLAADDWLAREIVLQIRAHAEAARAQRAQRCSR
jgi:hypothetical protein